MECLFYLEIIHNELIVFCFGCLFTEWTNYNFTGINGFILIGILLIFQFIAYRLVILYVTTLKRYKFIAFRADSIKACANCSFVCHIINLMRWCVIYRFVLKHQGSNHLLLFLIFLNVWYHHFHSILQFCAQDLIY
jgi:hypothetical protein